MQHLTFLRRKCVFNRVPRMLCQKQSCASQAGTRRDGAASPWLFQELLPSPPQVCSTIPPGLSLRGLPVLRVTRFDAFCEQQFAEQCK